MTPQQMLEQMIDKATFDFLGIVQEEEEGDYGDAMLSMERTEASGYVDGLSAAYQIIFNKEYVSNVALDESDE